MRNSQRLSLEGSWEDPSNDLIKTRVHYKLLNYGQLLKIRSDPASDKILDNIFLIENMEIDGILKEEIVEDEIKKALKLFNTIDYTALINTMLEDSILSKDEYLLLDYLTYYLNWKADEHTRKISYNCDKCKKFNYIDSRFCYLEAEEIELPHFKIEENEGVKTLIDSGSKLKTDKEFLQSLSDLTWKEPELSLFQIGLKYFSSISMDEKPGKNFEVCPEAFKVKAEILAELFEMESRTSEYHVLPFKGSQVDQPSLVLEAFDIIRGSRNLFHAQKIKEISKKK